MKFFDYDSHTILNIIQRDYANAAMWQIEPYFNSNSEKCVRLIWTPSKLVYHYLEQRFRRLEGECEASASLFRLYRMNVYGWRQPVYTIFSDGHIIADWHPSRPASLSRGRVNARINGLTAQLIRLVLRIPYWDGLVTTTKSSRRWPNGLYHSDYFGGTWPCWKTLNLRCFISSARGIYARDENGNLTSLRCDLGPSDGLYKKYHRGKFNITIMNHETGLIIAHHSITGRQWFQYIRHHKITWRWSINNGLVYYQNHLLHDSSTKQPVQSSDYIIPAHRYYI